jgi:MoxR-like ATPase
MPLSYDDLKLPNYVNTRIVGNIGGVELILQDVIAGGLFAGLNFFMRGQKSTGKTQLMRDVYNSYFGGSENALWETGRPDFKPSEIYEELNLSLARGTSESLPKIKAVLNKKGELEHMIETSEGWEPISEQYRDSLIKKYSATTDSITALKNLDKKAFFIDEFNRCPEVIMNTFYGMMTGEFQSNGSVVHLGNGYYAGMAAANPENYDGTFDMDAAMWARFHIVLDFDAFPPRIEDDNLLNKRNLAPTITASRKKNLTREIEAQYSEISHEEPDDAELAVLQYFENGMHLCVKDRKSKSVIKWPASCMQGCENSSGICGSLSGLDRRAVAAVYRLAKGLERVALLKDSNAEIDPIESLTLAYKFVAPYKGVVSPRNAGEKAGIEALVLEEEIPAIRENLRKKIALLSEINKRYSDIDSLVDKDAPSLALMAKDRGLLKEYDELRERKKQEFGVSHGIPVADAVRKEHPQELLSEMVEEMKKRILGDRGKEEKLIAIISKAEPETAKRAKILGISLSWTENDYNEYIKKNGMDKSMGFDAVIASMKENYEHVICSAVEQGVRTLKDAYDFMDSVEENTAEVEKSAFEKILKSVKIDGAVAFSVPEENMDSYKKALREGTIELLFQKEKEELKKKVELLTKDEWDFMKIFVKRDL